jgi:hypothetical protein
MRSSLARKDWANGNPQSGRLSFRSRNLRSEVNATLDLCLRTFQLVDNGCNPLDFYVAFRYGAPVNADHLF